MNILVAADGRARAIWRFVLALLVIFFSNTLAAGIASLVGCGRRFELAYRPLALVLAVAGFALLLFIADHIEARPLAAMGLVSKRWMRDAALGLLIGFLMVTVAVAVISVFGNLTVTVTVTGRTLQLAAVELVVLASGAMMEEVMFRGYPFQRLVESVGAPAAIAVLSGLFGAAHWANPNSSVWGMINTAGVGVLFSIAYLRTRSLWLPWGIHFAWNATLGLLFGLPVSGIMSFAVIVRSKATGPIWLTGGSYGIEASALGSAVIAAGLIAVLIFITPRPHEEASEVAGELSLV